MTATDGLYTISFSDIHLNPFAGTVHLDNIRFVANDKVYRQMRSKGTHPTHLYSVAVKRLSLKRIHPFKVYFQRNLDVRTLHIDNPVVRVTYQNPRDDSNEPLDKRTAWQRLSKYLKSIKIQEILLDNVDFQYNDRSLGKPEIDGVKNLSVRIDDLLIDSLSQHDKSRFYFTKEVFVQIRKHEFLSRDKMYSVLFDDLQISSSRRYAQVKGLQVIPRYADLEFSKRLPARKAMYNLILHEAILSNIDIKRLIDKRQLRASSLRLLKADMKIFLDKRKEAPKFDRGINFPQLALKRIRLNTLIDTVNIQNSSLHYHEYSPVTARTGRIFFNGINAKLSNFTNDTITINENNWLKGSFSAMLFGKSRLDFAINFDLRSPFSEYKYSGQLSEMNARNFNQLSRPLAMLRINAGRISSAKFYVKGNYRKSSGRLTMGYENLSIGLLKIDSQKVLRKQMLKSIVANNLLIKEDNPSTGEALRLGNISYYRPDSVTFLGTIWQSLFSGLRETIGLTPERERNLKEQFQGNSQESPYRDKRRESRKERRRRNLKK
ncbi:hypothetical protein [Desertivirga xinjiangensis]|uniref:hypothetical protein n=1 Tax=Desertivirga xinjiangensis TaxID=539206 RepID=UPI00210E40BD|nr:hypothetical protein [Pedobacter xinjiangensis]